MVASALRARQVIAGALLAGAGLLAASCGSPSAARRGSAAPATTPATAVAGAPAAQTASLRPCATAALRIRLGPRISLSAGHIDRWLDFTSHSGASCTLYGYPAVSFVTAVGGSEVGAAAGRIPAPKRLAVLAPGATARAILLLIGVLSFGPACSPRPAHGLRVYPPGQRTARYIALAAMVCSGPKPVYADAGPVQPPAS